MNRGRKGDERRQVRENGEERVERRENKRGKGEQREEREKLQGGEESNNGEESIHLNALFHLILNTAV